MPIDYSKAKGNHQLTEFFLHLDQMAGDPEARGWDPTVKNVVIDGNDNGRLIDFDLARHIDETGAWQNMHMVSLHL